MIDDDKVSDLLDRAQAEENLYNWSEAAKLYEQAAKIFVDKKKGEEAANAYLILGYMHLYQSEIANTKEDFVDEIKGAIESYNNAAILYNQNKNVAEELESRAGVAFANHFIAKTVAEVKHELIKAHEFLIESSKLYSKRDDKQKEARTLSKVVYISLFLVHYLSDYLEFEHFLQLTIELTDKAWKNTKKIGNIQYFAESILGFFAISTSQISLKDFKKDNTFKEYLEKTLVRLNEALSIVSDCDNNRALAIVNFVTGTGYCAYSHHYGDQDKKLVEIVEKGLDFLEKALEFAKKAGNKYFTTLIIFYINWWALFGRKLKYVQVRIYKDVKEVLKIGKIYDGLNTIIRFYAYFFPVFYYSNMAQRSFFTFRQRKSYAEKGIEYAKKSMQGLLPCYFVAWPYQMLTYSYSELTTLSNSKEDQDIYASKMLKCAKEASKIGSRYEGGVIRAIGYSSLYRANKTLADLSEDIEEKEKLLLAAADASKKYLAHTTENWRTILIGQIRLGLLYEDIYKINNESVYLIKAKEIFINTIKESLKSGYFSYAATANEYIARIEDRMGNFNASAEQYKEAQESYSNSLETIKYRLLKEKIKEKIFYVNAWNLIEMAKLYHKAENHFKSKENYDKASQILKGIASVNYEASYFHAWTFLEDAERLSKAENHLEAIKYYEISIKFFDDSFNQLNEILDKTKDKLVKERIRKLTDVAKVRINYCFARVDLESARILGKNGEHLEAAGKFVIAAEKFKAICSKFKLERERRDLEAIYYLCKAWENMEIAEKRGDSKSYAQASNLFEKSSQFFGESKLKDLSLGNSAICQSLVLGSEFDESIEIKTKADLYPKIKIMLRKAAASYSKGGFGNAADWALATSTYFDAAWHLICADEEMNLEEKKRLLKIGSEIFKSAAELFRNSGYKKKEKEILERLEMVKKEEKIIISALNTIIEPSITKSTVGIIAPACHHESSQSPRISEVREIGDEMAKTEIEKETREKYKLIYKDLLKDNLEIQQQEFRIGIAQIGLSSTSDIIGDLYTEDGSGLLNLRKDKVDFISDKVKEMVKNAYDNGVNILIFPEMAIDLNYNALLEDISNLAKKFNMYIIPGSYHDLSTRRNVCSVISPDGILWEQEKNIPAMINFKGTRFKEGIESGRFPRKVTICNTEYGRIAITICRDFLDMDLRVELKNFEPPVDLIFNPAFTPVTADFKAAHFDARRSIYAYCFFANIGEYGNSLIYTPEKERVERTIPPKEEGLIYKDIDLFKLRSERKKWQKIHEKEKQFIQSTR